MKKGLLAVLAVLIVFAMLSCDSNPNSSSDKITIKFDLNGGPGEKPANVTITKGGTLGSKYPDLADRNTATQFFGGWFNGSTEITATTKLKKSVTLKAKWGDGGFEVPTDWISFTEAEMLDAGFYINVEGEGDHPTGTSITKTGDAYTVTLKTVTTTVGRSSVVWVSFADVAGEPRKTFRNGWYANLTLPTSGVRPVNVQVIPVQKGKKGADGDIAWSRSQDANNTGDLPATFVEASGDFKGYVVGDLSMHWGTEDPVDTDHVGLAIWLMWAPAGTADGATYTFTINGLSVLPHTGGEDPPLTAWVPGAKTSVVTTGWVDFPVNKAGVTFVPAGGTIVDKAGGGYTVTAKTRNAKGENAGHTEIVIPADDFSFTGGYYLSLTLPTQTIASTKLPKRIYTYLKGPGGDNWDSAADLSQAFKWVEGLTDCATTDGQATGEFNQLVLQIYWNDDVTAGQDFEFTINSFKVKAKVDPWENFVEFAAGGSKTSGVIGANWNDTYNQAVFNFERTDDKLFQGGFYVSATFGAASTTNAARPEDVVITAFANAAADYGTEQQVPISADTVNVYWDGTAVTTKYEKIEVVFRWDIATTDIAGKTLDVTFNAVKVKALVTAGGGGDPEPWPDTIISEPGGMTALTETQMLAMDSNWNVTHSIEKESDTYKVTVKGSAAGGSELRLMFDPETSFQEAYLSLEMPETNDVRATQIKVLQGTAFGAEWGGGYESPVDAEKYYGGKLDISYDFGGSATSKLFLYLYLTETDEDYTFTINKISVK